MIGISMVRNEADIIGRTLHQLLPQVDRIVVLDNGSTDGTTDLLHDLGVEVIYDPDAVFLHGQRMTALADTYAKPDEWVVPFDGDELWNLEGADLDTDVLRCKPWVCLPDGTRTHQEPQWKCMFRYRSGVIIDTGQHNIFNAGPYVRDGLIEVEHYQFRSLEQVKRKVRDGTAALDRAHEHPLHGTHWRDMAKLTDDELAAWWDDYCRR